MARMLEPGTGTCGQIDRPPPEPPPEPPPPLHHTWNTIQQTGQTMPKPHEGTAPLQRMPAHSEKLEPQLPAQAPRWGSRANPPPRDRPRMPRWRSCSHVPDTQSCSHGHRLPGRTPAERTNGNKKRTYFAKIQRLFCGLQSSVFS